MLQFMGFQRVEHNSVTELNWAENHKVIMTLEVKNLQSIYLKIHMGNLFNHCEGSEKVLHLICRNRLNVKHLICEAT